MVSWRLGSKELDITYLPLFCDVNDNDDVQRGTHSISQNFWKRGLGSKLESESAMVYGWTLQGALPYTLH